MNGGDALARGAKSANFPASDGKVTQERWDEIFGARDPTLLQSRRILRMSPSWTSNKKIQGIAQRALSGGVVSKFFSFWNGRCTFFAIAFSIVGLYGWLVLGRDLTFIRFVCWRDAGSSNRTFDQGRLFPRSATTAIHASCKQYHSRPKR